MIPRPLGDTGLTVSALGLGTGPLGEARLSEAEGEALVGAALDLGITFFDTARSYGASEARLGRALRGRRGEAILSTKVGYGVASAPDWTYASVARGVDEALVKLGTEWLDVVHLHSCPREVLSRGEVTGALADAVRAGKARVAGYSGENEALDEAVASGAFGSIELSVSPWDQGSLDRVLWRAKERGMGAVAKRPLANAWWSFDERPSRPDVAAYWDRGRALDLPDFGLPLAELSLRFAIFTWGVDCAIAGTSRPDHLRALARVVERGPLPPDVVGVLRERFRERGAGLPGLV